ncbi:MAG TPA: hypothetical protein VHN14_28740 [Kofleriaceae bacterium]|nr:hypothetical protein [Kofleriaceae bacterium]
MKRARTSALRSGPGDDRASYLHVHYAKPRCYAARMWQIAGLAVTAAALLGLLRRVG